MKRQVVFLDANVLFSPALRDLLIELSCAGVCRVRWSGKVHEEWMHAVAKARPDVPVHVLEEMRRLIDQSAPDSLVQDYEHRIDGLDLPDSDDRHVLAAAIEGGCNVLLTRNLKDFPKKILKEPGIKALAPDRFLSEVFKSHKDEVLGCMHAICERLGGMEAAHYLAVLRRNRLRAFVNLVEKSEV